MGGAVSLTRKNKEVGESQETAGSTSEPKMLPNRGILRTLGFKRSAVTLPHAGSWLEVNILEAQNLPAVDENGLSDPYVEINFDGDSTSRKTVVRKKTLNPNWCHPLLLEVRSDRAVGELTKKGAKKGCYWFQYGNRLVLKVWDWNATTPDVLLGSATLDLRALSATRSEVEQEREEAAFQSRLAAKDAKRTRKPHSATSDADDEDAAWPHGSSSQALAAGGRSKDHYGDGGHGAGGGGVKAEKDDKSEVDAAPEGTTAVTTQHAPDFAADFVGKVQLEGPPVHRWVDLNRGGQVLVAFKWRWDRTDTTDALLSVHIGSGVYLPAMDPDGFSDPFVKVEVLGWSKATRICHRTLFPTWDETVGILVKNADLLETSLCLSIWDDDEGKEPDPMGTVEIPLQDLSFSKPIKMQMYRVTLDKSLLKCNDDDGLLPPNAKEVANGRHERRIVPWPEEPQDGEPGLQFEVRLGPARKITTPDRCVQVTCKEARCLIHPFASRSDVGPDAIVAVSLAGFEKKTKLRLANKHPVWNQTLNLDLWSDLLDATLLLEVKHSDELGRETLLGRTSISLFGMSVDSKLSFSKKLVGGHARTPQSFLSPSSPITPALAGRGARGKDGKLLKVLAAAVEAPDPEISFSVQILSHDASRVCDAQLKVMCVQARNLPALDAGGTSDPYMVVRFEAAEKKTSVVYRSLAPVWRETLTFDTSLRDMGTILELECFDYDLSSKDDSMGSSCLDLAGMRVGDHRACWVNLGTVSAGSNQPAVHLEYALVPKRKSCTAAAHVTLTLLRADKLKVPGVAHLNPYVRVSYEDTVRKSRVLMDTMEPDFSDGGHLESTFRLMCDYPPRGRIELEVFSHAMTCSDVCVGLATVDVSLLSVSKVSELCLSLIPTSALDPDADVSSDVITASGRLYVSLELQRNHTTSLFVVPGGTKGKSKSFEEGTSLLKPLLTGLEAKNSRRQVLSVADGMPVLKDGKEVWVPVRKLSLDSRDEAAQVKYFSTRDLVALEEAASQLTPLEEEKRTEMMRRERDDEARTKRDRAFHMRLRQQKIWNHANRCALCARGFSVLEAPVKCRVCGLLYHAPRVRTVITEEQTCFHRHKRPEAEEYAARKRWEADDEREYATRARWDREHLWRVKSAHEREQQQQLALLSSVAAFSSATSAAAGKITSQDPQEQGTVGRVSKGHWGKASATKRISGTSLPRLEALEPRRDNRSRWLYGSIPSPGIGLPEAFRVAHVYVAGDCWDTQSEKEALSSSILPALHTFLAAHRVTLVPVDCRIGTLLGSNYAFNIIRTVLDEVERCMPLLIGFLGDRYGWAPPLAYRMHPSLAGARFDVVRTLPQGLSLTHIELLYAYHRASAKDRGGADQGVVAGCVSGWKHCSFYLRDSTVLKYDQRFLQKCDQDDERVKMLEKEEFERNVLEMDAAHAAAAKKARLGPQGAVDKVVVQLLEGADLASFLAFEEDEEDEDTPSEAEEEPPDNAHQEADAAAAAAAARSETGVQKQKKKKPGILALGGQMLKHMFAPPGGAGKGQGRLKKGYFDDAPDLNGLDDLVAGNEGAGSLDGREGAEGKNQVPGKQTGKKKNVRTDADDDDDDDDDEDDDDDDELDGSESSIVSGKKFGGAFGFKMGKQRHRADVSAAPAQAHADPATNAAASNTEAAAPEQAVDLGMSGNLEEHSANAATPVAEASYETTLQAPAKKSGQGGFFSLFGRKKKSSGEDSATIDAHNKNVKTSIVLESTNLTARIEGEVKATSDAEGYGGGAENGHTKNRSDGGTDDIRANSDVRCSKAKMWLPKFRTLQVSRDEMAQLSLAASELHIESLEVLQVLHDVLDILELAAQIYREGLEVQPSTTAAFLAKCGKVWPTFQSASTAMADAGAVAEVESDKNGNVVERVDFQTSLGVYARIKIGDEVVTSKVVHSTGLLEAGYIGGEWDFDSQEFVIDCLAPQIQLSIYLKTIKPHPPRQLQKDDDDDPSREGGVRKAAEEHISDSDNGVSVERNEALKFNDPSVAADGQARDSARGHDDGKGAEQAFQEKDSGTGEIASAPQHSSAMEDGTRKDGNTNTGQGVEKTGDVLLGTAVISVSKLIPSRWTTPRVDFEGNGSATMMIRIKLLRALLPMPLDEGRRARRISARAQPMETMVLPSLRQRHTTSDPAEQILLRDLKVEIINKGCVCFVNYPATFAGLSSTSTSGAHTGYQYVVLDSLSILGERIRRDMLENLAALHMLEQRDSNAHVAARPFDRFSMEWDYHQGYRARMNSICVGRDVELEKLRDLCWPQSPQLGQHCAILVVGSPGSGKSTLLVALETQLRNGMSSNGAGERGKRTIPPAVVAVYIGGMISPLNTVRDLMYWLTARLAAETSEDVSATASCFVMHNVELPSQKDRREKQQAELSYEELNAVWCQYLSTSVERSDFLPMPSTYLAPPKRFPGRKTIVIIDGLDHIQVPSLTWVPSLLPESVELILSCSDSTSDSTLSWVSELTQGNRIREERVIRLSPLSLYARKELVAFYLLRGGGTSGGIGKGWGVSLGEHLTMKHMDTIVSQACHEYPDALNFTCAYISQVAQASGHEHALSSFPQLLPHHGAPEVDTLCKGLIDRACVECGVQAVGDLFGFLAAARDGSLMTLELRHLLHAVPFPAETTLPRDEVALPSDGNGRGSVGVQLLSWGKWMLIRNSVDPFLTPCGVETLHAPCFSIMQRRLSAYAVRRFHPHGVGVEIHARMGCMYRRLCDPEGGCSWRGATQERALMALPHHFRGARMANTIAYLFLDLGYLSACVAMGQMSIHRALVEKSLSESVVIQLMQVLLWLSRSLLHLSVHKGLIFQSAINEAPFTAPNMLAISRLQRNMEGNNLLRQLNLTRSSSSGHTPAQTKGQNVAGIAFRSIWAHRGKCSRVTISKCGSLWACAGDDGFFKIYNSWAKMEAKLGESNEEGRRPRATALCFSPDSTLLATASIAGGGYLYDTRTGLECASFMVRHILSPEEVAQKIRKNEQRLAANRANPAGAIAEDETWGFVVTSLVFSSCGSLLLAGCVDGNCHIFEVATSACVRRLIRRGPQPSAAVRCCSWSLEEKMTAAGADRLIVLWEVGRRGGSSVGGVGDVRPSTQAQARGIEACAELSGHRGNINGVAWSPNGQLLVSGADDCLIFIWDGKVSERGDRQHEQQDAASLPGGAVARLKGHTAPVLDVTWSLSGRYIFASDFSSAVLVWSFESRAVLYSLSGHSGAVYSLANGLGDNTLLTGCSDGSFRVWDLRSVLPIPAPAGEYFASEAELVAVTKAALGIDVVHSRDATPAEEQPQDDEGFSFTGPDPRHTGRVTAINYSPTASFLLSAGADGRMIFRKGASGRALAQPSRATPHADGLFDARFLPANSFFVTTAAGDGVVAIWDVRGVLRGGADAPDLVRRLSGHSAAALAAVGHPQKPEILSSSRDRTVRLWDLERGVVVAGLNRAAYSGTEGAGGCTCSLDFSPCGALALTAGGAREVWVWDLRTCTPVRRLIGSGLESVCASFSPAGGEVVGGSKDGAVRIWDCGGRLQHVAQLHSAPVTSCRFSQRGAHLVSSSEDGSVLVIDAYDLQAVGRWATDTAISAVDCANIKGGHVAFGDETGSTTILTTHVGLCGRWQSF